MAEPEQLKLFDTAPYEKPEETAPDAPEVICGFMVVVKPDGSSQAVLDTSQEFKAQRPATPQDIYPALANITADFMAMKTAEAVISFQQQFAAQMVHKQQVAEIQQKLQSTRS